MTKTNNYPQFGVLLVDDERSFLLSLSITLERRAGITNIVCCQDSCKVMDILATQKIGVIALDLTMPNLSGEQLLAQIMAKYPHITVIVISGLNQVETAVNCMKLGAFEYFVKTDEESRIIDGFKRAIAMQELQIEKQALRDEVYNNASVEQPEAFSAFITADKKMHSIFRYLESVSRSRQPILITGESGVGKELIANAIHALSGSEGPIVNVNVAGLDDNVFSDTLFGHKRGAFTGADQPRAGMVEKASGGTLFLDEIGDLSLTSQVKLLRLLQESEYYPLGSDQPKIARTRIIAATHRNLEEMQAEGEFRNDLYYRLRTHQVNIPPLRMRRCDIPLLLDHFLQQAATELDKKVPTYPNELPTLLSNYSFPGNARELRAMVYDAMCLHKSRMLSMDTFKELMKLDTLSPHTSFADQPIFNENITLPELKEISSLLVEEAMKRANGNQSIAAKLLGVSQPALSKRLKNNKAE